MMYNDVDNDLPPFNDTIDGEEIFLFSNTKTSSTGASFLNEDDDEHLRHQHNVVASTSSHLPVDVDELLLNSNFLEQPNCDQSEDPLFWNCKDISDDQLNEFLPQSQLNLSSSSGGNTTIPTSNNNNAINNNNNITIIQQAQITLNQQHSQAIIPTQHLQTQSTVNQQHQHQHLSLQAQQIRLIPDIDIHQQQVTTLQHHQQPSQLQPQPSQHSGYIPQQILQHEQYPTKWVTLVQTNDQYQTFTPQHTQFFDKVSQPLIQNSDINGSQIQTSILGLVSTNDQSHVDSQQQQVQVSQAQSQQVQPQQQSATTIPPYQTQPIDQKPKITVPNINNNINNSNNNNNINNNNNNINNNNNNNSNNKLASKKEVIVKQKPKEKQTRLDCPYCKRSFSKNFDLQQHMRCHTGEKPFQCIVCGRGFAQKSNVKKHMQAHKVWPEGPNNPPIPSNHQSSARSRNNSASSSMGTPRDDECMQENESSQINDNNLNNNGISLGLSNDRKNDGNDMFVENRYSCSYCRFNGRTYFELKSHLTIHKREKVFKCIVSSCGKTFSGSDLQGFLDHVTGHKDLIYHCHLCSGQFYSLDEFGEHQKHHSNAHIKRTSQPQAQAQQQSSASVLNLQNNTSLRQQNQQVTTTQLQPQQNHRQYNQQQTQTQHLSYQKSSQLYNNQQPKKNQKFFRCSKCMNRYTTQNALDHHLSISTHNFPCTECNKVFMCERYLRRHLNTHTAVQHVCTFCDKQFKTAAYLKMHSVVHTGEKPFRCNLCEAAFNRRDKLNRHKLTHETVKKFKCPFKHHIGCTKEFNRPDKLKAHVLTHSGTRPYACDACSKTFSRGSRLRDHKKSHHEGKINGNLKQTSTTSEVIVKKEPNLSPVTTIDIGSSSSGNVSEIMS